MSTLAVVHIAASMVMLFVAVPAAYRAGTPVGRIAALTAGLAAAVSLVTGAVAYGPWTRGYRAAVELASQSAAGWLDAKIALGTGACLAALIACAVETRQRAQLTLAARILWTASVLLALAGLAMIAAVHARVPSALL